MAIVVDASVVLATLLREPQRETLLEITAGHELVSPASLPYEVGNALSATFKRKRLSLQQAEEALHLFGQMGFTLVPVSIQRSVQIAHQLNLYAYDAYMIDASSQNQLPLLTLDRRLRDAASLYGVQLIEVSP